MRGPRRGRCCRGRPLVPRRVALRPLEDLIFLPNRGMKSFNVTDYIELYDDELEAMRLVHVENKSVDEASALMGVSGATFWRILESGRRKVTEALVNLKPIKILSRSTYSEEVLR